MAADTADPDCRDCERGVAVQSAERRVRTCRRHMDEATRAHLADLERRARPIIGRAWPYGPNIDAVSRRALVEWAEPLGVRLSSSRCQGMHWISRGRCPYTPGCAKAPWADHVTHWNWRGRPALTLTQPYLAAQDLRRRVETAAGARGGGPDLHVDVGAGWYGAGTSAALIWRADVRSEVLGAAR